MNGFTPEPVAETGSSRHLGGVAALALSREPIRLMNGRRRVLLTPAAIALSVAALGIGAGAAGASFGVADLVHSGNASIAQYSTTQPPVTLPPAGKVLGVSNVAPSKHASTPTPTTSAPAAEPVAEHQVVANEVELPFTGLLVLPLLLVGLALAAIGVILRRRLGTSAER